MVVNAYIVPRAELAEEQNFHQLLEDRMRINQNLERPFWERNFSLNRFVEEQENHVAELTGFEIEGLKESPTSFTFVMPKF